MSAIIEVRDLRKTFRVSERETGMGATLRAFVKRRYKDVPAIAGISSPTFAHIAGSAEVSATTSD